MENRQEFEGRDVEEALENARRALGEVQQFKDYYTTFEPFTDRLDMRDLTRACSVAYLGGYYTRNSFVNSHAVSWQGFGTDYATATVWMPMNSASSVGSPSSSRENAGRPAISRGRIGTSPSSSGCRA